MEAVAETNVESVAEKIVESVAVGGVAAMWSYFTLKTVGLWFYFTHETLKICDKILFPPPLYRCKKCSYDFTSDFVTEREDHDCYIYVCDRCIDEELETSYDDEKICI